MKELENIDDLTVMEKGKYFFVHPDASLQIVKTMLSEATDDVLNNALNNNEQLLGQARIENNQTLKTAVIVGIEYIRVEKRWRREKSL